MPEAWQSAWVEVLPDFREFTRKSNSEITSSLGSAGTAGGQKFKSSFGAIVGGSFLGNLGAQLAVGIASGIGQGIRAGIDFGLDGIQLASSLGEQVNAVQVQFGDFSDEILALGKKAPRSLNLTQAAFAKLAVRFSSFAKTVAGQGGDVAGVVGDLTQRGADFASVYDIDVNQALETFQSGLAGQSEPLRAYGIDLSEATVKQYAYANGIVAVGAELTEAEKIQARYGSLMEQTNSVSGDLSNTFGSLANQQRQFAVQVEEAQTKLGGFLLPAFTTLVSYANTTLLPKLGEIIEQVGPILGAAFEGSAPQVQALLDKVAPLALKFATMAADGLPGVIQGLEDAGAAASVLADAWAGFNAFLAPGGAGDISGALANGAEQVGDFFTDVATNTQGFLEGPGSIEQPGADWAMGFGTGIHASTSDVLASAAGMEQGAVDELDPFAFDSFGAGKDGAVGFARGISSGTLPVGRAARALAREAVEGLKSGLDAHSPSREMAKVGGWAWEGFIGGWENGAAPLPIPSVSIPTSGLQASQIANGSAATAGLGAGRFEGALYLDSGEFLGAVRGELQQKDAADALTTRMGSAG